MAIETTSNQTIISEHINAYDAESIAGGFVYECSCGERFENAVYAHNCRKCRNYCVFGYCTHVIDIRTGEVVMGKEPSEEEYAEASEAAHMRWEAERAEVERWEAEMRREEEAQMMQAQDEEEELLWDIQDKWKER